MAKRYGRNQKRQHREEQARLKCEIERLEAVNRMHYRDHMEERTRRIHAEQRLAVWADRIVTLLGEQSAYALDISERVVEPGMFDSITLSGMPLHLRPPVGPLPRLGPTQEAMVMDRTETVFEGFSVFAARFPDRLQSAVRFQITAKDRTAALIVDNGTLHRLREAHSFELAQYLLLNLIEPWMKGENEYAR